MENPHTIMQVIHIPVEELKFDYRGESGKNNFMRVYNDMSEKSKANIKATYTKDKSLTFLVEGKLNEVLEIRREILMVFKSQTKRQICIPKEHHGWILGTQGLRWKELEKTTSTKIQIPHIQDQSDVITITGTEEDVEKAELALKLLSDERVSSRGLKNNVDKAEQQLLELSEKMRSSSLSVKIRAEAQYHKFLIGKNGAIIKKISKSTGAQIVFPTEEDEDKEVITIIGNRDAIDKAKAELESTMKKIKSMVTIECEFPRKHRSVVMGSKGCKLQAIRAEFNVQIKFPDRFAQDEHRPDKPDSDEEGDVVETVPDYDVVRITGQPDNAEAAKQALLGLVPIAIKINVPNDFHRSIIGPRGRDVRELMDKYEVQIVLSRPDENLDYVTICGLPLRVNEAKEAVLDKCKTLEAEWREKELKSYKLKIEVDSEYHPKIIGHSGSVIKQITSDNDVTISFPCIGDPEDNIITITGYKENVHNARDVIIEKFNELKQKQSMVLEQVQENAETNSCESPTSSTELDIIGCEVTRFEKRSQDLSNVHRELINAEDDIKIKHQSEQLEEVHTEMQALSERLSISYNSMSVIQEHTNVITDTLRYYENKRNRLMELCKDEIMKQEAQMKDLKERLNEQVSLNKVLKIERDQLMLGIDNEREKCERLICEKEEKYDEETAKLSDTINNIESKLKAEREEKSKLIAEKNESSQRFNELVSKHQALEVTSSEYKNETEYSKSAMTELKENETRLTNELVALKNTHCAAIADEKFKSIGYRKQLADLTLAHTKTTSKLNELTSYNTELSATLSKKDQDIALLKNATKTKDDKISKLNTDLSKALENNKDLTDIIESLNAELATKEEEIYKTKRNFEIYKANVDENVLREKASHEARLEKIKLNVYDLKEKLIEITQDIHNSSEICEMFNEDKSASSSHSDP